MNDGDEMARELWRRALALTGRGADARWVAGRALAAEPGGGARHRRDRLITLGAREVARRGSGPTAETEDEGAPNFEGEARQLWEASRRLPRLPMEAWTLRVIEGMEEIRASRALDCSRGAMAAALEEAERRLRPLLGDRYTEAVESLRLGLAGVDPASSLEKIRTQVHKARNRRRLVSAAQIAIFFICAATLVWVGIDLLRSDRENKAPAPDPGAALSAPMPRPEVGGAGR